MKQGNVQQSPVTFLNQENSDTKLLVIIKNAEISGNIHTVSHCCLMGQMVLGGSNTKKTRVLWEIPFVESSLSIVNRCDH